MFSKSVLLAGAVGAALFMSASAQAVTLDTLTGSNFGGQIVSGNFIYSNFTYGGTTPSSSVVVNSTATGLEFTTSNGGWTTPSGSSVISYDVTVTSGTVDTVNLGFSATATGDAVASVGETVTDTATHKDYSLQVATSGNSNLPSNSSDSVTLNPATSTLHVVKSIDVAGSGSATITPISTETITRGRNVHSVVSRIEPWVLAISQLSKAMISEPHARPIGSRTQNDPFDT